jgi:DNA-binding IclR family transcriptional regulator
VNEIVHKTALSPAEAIDALAELEEQGLVTPWAWGLGPEAER